MSKDIKFTADVERDDGREQPTISLHRDPNNKGNFIACFQSTDCDEVVDGYTYNELLSIREAINSALTEIDVRESINLYNDNPGKNHLPF